MSTSESRLLTQAEVLHYEVFSSWWASFVPHQWTWLSERVSSYYAWKAKRKYARYKWLYEYAIAHKMHDSAKKEQLLRGGSVV